MKKQKQNIMTTYLTYKDKLDRLILMLKFDNMNIAWKGLEANRNENKEEINKMVRDIDSQLEDQRIPKKDLTRRWIKKHF